MESSCRRMTIVDGIGVDDCGWYELVLEYMKKVKNKQNDSES